MTPIRLVVADDQSLIRLALRVLVADEDDIELAGEAEDGPGALELVTRERPDVALLDIRMPTMDGLEVLRRICADPVLSGTRVVIMTTFDIDRYVFEALSAGAAGFVTKDTDPGEILRAVRVVAGGESLLSPSVTRKVIGHFSARTPGPAVEPHPRLSSLTAREREILGWVATGRSNDEIAERLVVSPATVRTHIGRSMMKLGARDRAQLVVFAYRSGVEIPE
ncbi:response regulator [Phytomonospora endophytica]|uniref:DNA-binding NarL/FixJ family response regulator n=1 Tax=Phytomonospora endophytica TaxID=714109 RepID=A0A841FLZ8_9ACTN|nr:response regulator transcription factor [Phytomonospora endophytica]MBB6037176.1 DNA-binding NarL/FixJ family response regulator [Phytomonospora endophytica]GIG71216.1 DNA-binding response regulator [Phytomonospora endophytica]